MMAQYLAIKAEAGEALLFYRMGDFYELFFDDAVHAAKALDIALTRRGKHQGADIPMCGVPVHSSETYLQKLIRAGFRVAVCEQTEDPAEAKKRGSKAVVQREIVRLVTPGTLTEDALLERAQTNVLAALARTRAGDRALAWAEVSEGSFGVCALEADAVASEVRALAPSELLVLDTDVESLDLAAFGLAREALTPVPAPKWNPRAADSLLRESFGVADLGGWGDLSPAEVAACGALVDYLQLTQRDASVRLQAPKRCASADWVRIDPSTRASLEITQTLKGTRAGSLLATVDRTQTGAGARELARRLQRPLRDAGAINTRLDAVARLVGDGELRALIRSHLDGLPDAARAATRLRHSRGGPRDLRGLAEVLERGRDLNAMVLKQGTKDLAAHTRLALDALSLGQRPALARLARDVLATVREDAPLLARDGGFVRDGVHAPLDALRQMRVSTKATIAGLQAAYAELSGVSSLKVRHNNQLGYHVEVTPRHADTILGLADSPFIHRQTLVSGVRFSTPELSELDARIAGASERAVAVEVEMFEALRARVLDLMEPILSAASAFAALDVQAASAEWAVETGACRPVVDGSLHLRIEAGRHPVVEAALRDRGEAGFTPNGVALDGEGASDSTSENAPRLLLVTGPNMAGKSTFLRQTALHVVLAQAGLFVPAREAHIGVADAVFSRVGASDDLAQGRSTFMVEMVETAAILNQAGPRAVVILDEIGRGTATFDGLSLAWATLEHLVEVNRSRALFATHYHELTDLAERLPGAANASLRAQDTADGLVFLHDVRPGPADKSYGVQVARLAGLPPAAVARARDVLERLESDPATARLDALPLFDARPPAPAAPPEPSAVEAALLALDPNTLSPRDALDLVFDLRAKLV